MRWKGMKNRHLLLVNEDFSRFSNEMLAGTMVFSSLSKGGVAEWLCSGLQSRGRRFDSDPRLQCPGGEIGRHKGLKIPR